MRTLLARTGFRRLLVGQGVSSLGDWMGTVALIALTLDLTASSTAVGVILVLRLAPSAVGGAVTARLVGRIDRRRTMLAMDLARIGIVALVPIVRAVWWVYIWAFLLECAGMVFLPARDASIPDLVDDDELQLANGLVLGSSYGLIPIGAGLYAALAAALGRGWLATGIIFWLDAASFAVSFVMIAGLHLSDEVRSTGEPGTERLVDAFRIPLVRRVLPAVAGAALGIGVLFSTGIAWVHEVLGASNAEFAALVAVFGIGAGAGLGLLRRTSANGVAAIRGALLVQGCAIAGMSQAPTLVLALVGAALFGGASAAALAAGMSLLQRDLPDEEERLLAFTGMHVVIRVGLALSAVGAGLAADAIGPVHWPVLGTLAPARVVLFAGGMVVILSALAVGRNASEFEPGRQQLAGS